jgi:5-methylcytosine-specific restriction endonuclease McrA
MKKATQFVSRKPNASKKFNGRQNIDDMYDSSWEKYRIKFLAVNPRCYSCGDKATVVDHVTPHKGDDKLFKQLDNHIPLCSRCHNTITTKFDRNYRVGSLIINKLKWITANRVRNLIDSRVKVLPKYED